MNNIIFPQKFVLTGGPCTGKTTLLNSLKDSGYQILTETATLIFQEAKSKGVPAVQGSAVSFQDKLISRQIKRELELKTPSTTFVDRGTVDNLAYCKYFNIHPPKELIQKAVNNKYDGIFLLSFLDKYENDEVRTEPFEEALKIHTLIKETYQEHGYQIIEVPPFDIARRVEFIENKIQEINLIGLQKTNQPIRKTYL